VVRDLQMKDGLTFEKAFLYRAVIRHHRDAVGPGRGEHAGPVDDQDVGELLAVHDFQSAVARDDVETGLPGYRLPCQPA
jgi:hypothetical protein